MQSSEPIEITKQHPHHKALMECVAVWRAQRKEQAWFEESSRVHQELAKKPEFAAELAEAEAEVRRTEAAFLSAREELNRLKREFEADDTTLRQAEQALEDVSAKLSKSWPFASTVVHVRQDGQILRIRRLEKLGRLQWSEKKVRKYVDSGVYELMAQDMRQPSTFSLKFI